MNKGNGKDEMRGSLYCATDGETVRCSGRDDDFPQVIEMTAAQVVEMTAVWVFGDDDFIVWTDS